MDYIDENGRVSGQSLHSILWNMLHTLKAIGAPAIVIDKLPDILAKWPDTPVNIVTIVFCELTRDSESAGHPRMMYQVQAPDIRTGFECLHSSGKGSIKTKVVMSNALRVTCLTKLSRESFKWTRRTVFLAEVVP
jgi:hypothetical protein